MPQLISDNSEDPIGMYLEPTDAPRKWTPCLYVGAYETEGSAYCWSEGRYWRWDSDEPNKLYPLPSAVQQGAAPDAPLR